MKKTLIILLLNLLSNILIAQEPVFGLTIDLSDFSTTEKISDYSFAAKVVPKKSTSKEHERRKKVDDTQYFGKK